MDFLSLINSRHREQEPHYLDLTTINSDGSIVPRLVFDTHSFIGLDTYFLEFRVNLKASNGNRTGLGLIHQNTSTDLFGFDFIGDGRLSFINGGTTTGFIAGGWVAFDNQIVNLKAEVYNALTSPMIRVSYNGTVIFDGATGLITTTISSQFGYLNMNGSSVGVPVVNSSFDMELYSINWNGKIFELNEGVGFITKSKPPVQSITFQTANAGGLTYWNTSVWTLIV